MEKAMNEWMTFDEKELKLQIWKTADDWGIMWSCQKAETDEIIKLILFSKSLYFLKNVVCLNCT